MIGFFFVCFCNRYHTLCTSLCDCRKLIFSMLFMNCIVRRFFFFFLFNMFVNCLWIVIARYFHSFLFLIHSNLLPYPLPWVNSNFWVTFCGVSLWLLGKDVTFLLVGRSSLGKVWVFNRAVNRPSILFFGSKRTLNLLYKTSGYLLPNSPVLATEAYCCLTTT